ncbi:hypothetical protein A1O3_03445 [Capronia epimyces CBS 606.96]|uniref:RNase MRP protein 1 RNA binding domain-containing protein n=1 Tax=Capronia epimyces CBS 606.96 TaxID=1182542 RepID=W9YW35_9EURO|nr:uncharacterized protein A1O3_03445 [Capronia epimyces CBS 606.96]EXJ86494.1 hypothetical protein A1O3_03445 [Capronia epimyces CBS 606.96]
MSTAKSLLDQIWARNRNQHRAQSWWKSLGMLRKAITRVVAMNDAERSLRLQSNAGVGATEAKEVRKRFEQESQIRRERDLWFDWMREVLVPRAYVGFTGLVSDSQFAALGVVLVGILADVMSVVGAPTRSVDEDDRGEQALHADKVTSKEQGGARVLTATSLKVTGLQSGEVVERIYHSDDVGEVVERTKLEISRDQVRLPARKDVPTADDGSAAYVTDSPSVGSDGSKGTGVSDAVLNFKANRGDRDRKKQKQDPKLKPLGNKDVESESKSKKKKKKNAIDDMFAGFL